jgi:hypothetical protein
MLRAAAVLALVLSAAAARADDGSCGDSELSDEALDAIAHAQDHEDAKTDEAPVQYKVPVYLHVVRRAPQGEGDMPVAHARAITIDVLNKAFAAQAIPFTFELAKIDYLTTGAETYNLVQNSGEEKALFDAMNVGGRRNLNIYIVGQRADTTVTGWAEFLFNPKLLRTDHVVLRYYPQTGGFSDPTTVVHEVGHWLGLLHTFQFGCGTTAHGDLIRDTPTQMSGHHSCAVTTDTCPDDAGTDPVDNIMGYGNGCRGVFSPAQITRMKFLYRTARGGKGDDITPPEIESEPASSGCHAGCEVGLLVGLSLLLLRRRS